MNMKMVTKIALIAPKGSMLRNCFSLGTIHMPVILGRSALQNFKKINSVVNVQGAAVAEWLSSWLAEQEVRGSIPRLATWIFRDWLSPASKSRYG